MSGAKGKSGGKRPGSGRKTFNPSTEQRRLIENLSAFGICVEDMPVFVEKADGKPVSEMTLRRHFKSEIRNGRLKANVNVAKAMYRNATEPSTRNPYGDFQAQKHWLSIHAGWREPTQRLEMTGANGGPIQNVNMTATQFRAIARSVLGKI
jgi:hypothetical protein